MNDKELQAKVKHREQLFSEDIRWSEDNDKYVESIKRYERINKGGKSRYNRRRNSSYLIDRIAKREGIIPQCRVCGTTTDLTIDHIIPLSAGGSNLMSNKQILCRNHNRCKGSYVPTNGWWPDNLMYVIEAHE